MGGLPAIIPPRAARVAANLRDYDEAAAAFSWAEARAELDGLPAGGINIAHEAVDRHARGDRSASLALVFLAGGADAASARAVSMNGTGSDFAICTAARTRATARSKS